MNLPIHTEEKLRRLAQKKGWSEVEYLHVRELTIFLRDAIIRERKRKIELKLKQKIAA